MTVGRQRRRTVLRCAGLVALALVAACGSGRGGAARAELRGADELSPAALDGNTYVSTDVDGHDLVADTHVTLVFTADSLSAIAGCNTMSGGFTIDDDTLQVAALAQTQMACSGELMAQDQWLSGFLTGGPSATLIKDVLTLKLDGTTITLGDREVVSKASNLDGSAWRIVSLDASGTTAAAADGSTLTFDGDHVYVTTGCNQALVNVSVDDGTITVGSMGRTTQACMGDLATWQAELIRFLAQDLTYHEDGDSLTLSAGGETLALHRL